MAFCGKCGTQLHDNATFCANCGAGTGVAAASPAAGTPVVAHPATLAGAPSSHGFFGALFDLSFTSFVTAKLIKVLFVLAIIVVALAAVGFVVLAQNQPSPAPVVSIIIAPIAFFIYIILVRVQLEILIVIFRMSEHLAEIAQQGRR
jgi:hypothetical protein